MTKPFVSTPPISLKLRRLETNDIAIYRDLRLESLKSHPEAFASSSGYESNRPASWWAERLETNTVFGGVGEQFASRRRGWITGAGHREAAA
jgi:hypothetical protein